MGIRSRVGLSIVGAILIGGIAAVAGAASVWYPETPVIGSIVQGNSTSTTQATAQPELTATLQATAAPQATATDVATPAPTATPNLVGSTIQGTVVSTNPSANSFIVSRNGVRYTISVNQATTYSGTATQLSDLKPNWRVAVKIAAQDGSAYLAQSISAALPDN